MFNGIYLIKDLLLRAHGKRCFKFLFEYSISLTVTVYWKKNKKKEDFEKINDFILMWISIFFKVSTTEFDFLHINILIEIVPLLESEHTDQA